MTQNLNLLDNVLKMNNEIGTLSEIVNRHDKITFPEILNTLSRMESKQNRDILQFNEEKGKINERLRPLEEDYKNRIIRQVENRQEINKIKWSAISIFSLGAIVGTYDHIIYYAKLVFNNLIN
jgi:predicted amidohydrolase